MARTTIDLNMFIAIKTLIKCGSSRQEVAEHLKISIPTVDRVKKAETYEEYRNMMCAMAVKIREREKERTAKQEQVAEEPKQEPKQEAKAQSLILRPTFEWTQEMRKQTEVLELISRKLSAILETEEKLLSVWSGKDEH